LLIWQISLQQLNVPVYLIPKPSDIGHALVSQSGLLFGSLWVTLKVTLLAFICAVVIGTLIAFLFVQSRVIEACFMPYAILFQVTPIVAIAPLVIIWIQNTTLALVVCHVGCYFPNFNQYHLRFTQCQCRFVESISYQ
jgi:NitT/TauT family transport system permease protein